MRRAELERALWAILDALREYADDVVLVGGWVPYLHLAYGRPTLPHLNRARERGSPDE